MDWINEAAVRDYIDAVVAVKIEESKVEKFGEIELIVSPDRVHVFRGIVEMAKASGCKLKEITHNPDDSYPFEYFFEYKGIIFSHLEKERMDGYEDV